MNGEASNLSDEYFMQLALEQAKDAERAGEIPVGAVVVHDGKVVSVGRNRTIEACDPTAHAEIIALRAAAESVGNHRMEGLELFVTLEPCPMCAGAIFHSRLSRLIYGAPDPKTGVAGSVTNLFEIRGLNHQTRLTAGVLREQCTQQLQKFFLNLRLSKASQRTKLRDDAVRPQVTTFSKYHRFLESGEYWMSSDGWRVHYIDSRVLNPRRNVVFLHDFPYWSYQCGEIFEKLRLSNFRIIAPDLLGCGLSDRPKRDDWHTVSNHAEIVRNLLKSLEIENLTIVASKHQSKLTECLAEILKIPDCNVIQFNSKSLRWLDGYLNNISKSVFFNKFRKFFKEAEGDFGESFLIPFPDIGHSAILKGMWQCVYGHALEGAFLQRSDNIYSHQISLMQVSEVLNNLNE